MYLNKKTEMKEKQKAFALSLTELSHIETQKNIRKSVIKITFFLIFIMGIMSYCYANGSFNKI